jgi:hypothetical protein
LGDREELIEVVLDFWGHVASEGGDVPGTTVSARAAAR